MKDRIERLVDEKMLEAKIGHGLDHPFRASVDMGQGFIATAEGSTPKEACERLEQHIRERHVFEAAANTQKGERN